MTNPRPSRPLLLDSTFLVAYEREVTRRAQVLVLDAVDEGRILATAALSLAVAAHELGGRHPNLTWFLNESEGPLQVLSLSAANALDVGGRNPQAGPINAGVLEVAQVVYEATNVRAIVMTYEPKLYAGQQILITDMRPQ